MAHKSQIEFCKQVKIQLPTYFNNVDVLDAGSLDINGANRSLFVNSRYIGVDMVAGLNVDVVSPVHLLAYPDGSFDTVISTEMFEHDKYYRESFRNLYRMLKRGGLLLFTCATTGRREHGTRRRKPEDNPSSQLKGFADYYKNLTADDFYSIMEFEDAFDRRKFIIDINHHDLYFWGLKCS
jgi:SAM-dependent methyltransferase